MRSSTIVLIFAAVVALFFVISKSFSDQDKDLPVQPIKLESSLQTAVGYGDARKIISGQPVESDVPGYWKVAFDARIPLDDKAYLVALVSKTVPDSLLVYGEEIFVTVIYLHDSPPMPVYLGEPAVLHEAVRE